MKYLITSDWHLRHNIPKCRTDDFQKAQWDKVGQIFQLARNKGAIIIHAGDLFEESSPHYGSVNQLMALIRKKYPDEIMYSIAGNHDLPNHNIKFINKCGYGAMINSGCITHLPSVFYDVGVVIHSANWKEPLPDNDSLSEDSFNIILLHQFVFPDTIPKHWKLSNAFTAKDLIRKYNKAQVIITGHNHMSFIEEVDGTVLINPGALTRHKADQKDHHPTVYLLDTEEMHLEAFPLKISKNVISSEHIDLIKKQEIRLEKYMEVLKDQQLDESLSIDYEKEVQELIDNSELEELVKLYMEKAVFPNRFTKEEEDELGTAITKTKNTIEKR
jgi:DNA repair exonuclease SbcCD nuclease subunit